MTTTAAATAAIEAGQALITALTALDAESTAALNALPDELLAELSVVLYTLIDPDDSPARATGERLPMMCGRCGKRFATAAELKVRTPAPNRCRCGIGRI